MDEKYDRCRWGSKDSLDDIYCVNGASEHCTEVVSVKDSPCKDCRHFFSTDDDENMKNHLSEDDDTEHINYE